MKRYFLIVFAIVLVALPFILFNSMEMFQGTDDQSVEVIENIAPDYKPWAESLWEPANDVQEAILFAFQTAIGVSLICFYIIYKRRQKKRLQA
ncbi:MAG: cobalt transport protein CbiN [Bacteroidales bacterium]|jgi:cobalt/nickel transport protein|nr:cobalt transport protein CbiN [Bacteroidales bacterium]